MRQKVNVPMEVCVNCNLQTPKINHQCVHCGRPRSILVPVTIAVSDRKPTPADFAAYDRWLIQQDARRAFANKGVI